MQLNPMVAGFSWLRALLIAVLVVSLLLLNYYDHALQAWLTARWYQLSADPGSPVGHLAAILQGHLPKAVAKRPLPVLLTFLGSYLTVSLLLLRLLLPQPGSWAVAWRTYAGLMSIYVALLLVAKLGGSHLAWAYPLARLVVELLGTPIPIAILVILLKYGPQENSTQESA